MTIQREEKLITNIYNLDNILFQKAPCSIVITVGFNDDGTIYYDAEINAVNPLENIATVFDADTLEDLLKELVENV